MIRIYRLTPKPKEIGKYVDGILIISGKKFKISEEEVLDHFSRGYYRCGRE